MAQKLSKAARDSLFAANKKTEHKQVSRDILGLHPYRRARKHTARLRALMHLAGGK